MKKFIFLNLLLCIFITKSNSQVYKYIPDLNFRNALVSAGCAFNTTGDSINISSPTVTSLTFLYCNYKNISNLEGIQYFTSLNILEVTYNNLTSIPLLSNSINTFNCSNNALTSITTLPINLTTFSCKKNLITNIAPLPSSLIDFKCDSNQLTSLPVLPKKLKKLSCALNFISSIDSLPDSLTTFNCMYNTLVTLPTLPTKVTDIICSHNNITLLPTLINSLKSLDCSYNNLASLPTLPPNINYLYTQHNSLSSLPTFPTSLAFFDCSYNSIATLPSLGNIIRFWCHHNLLTSLPSLPTTLSIFDCSSNQISTIPTINSNLTELYCSNNLLTILPTLPNTITKVYCDSNTIDSLPTNILRAGVISCSNNRIRIIPYTILTTYPTYYLNCSNNLITNINVLIYTSSMTKLNVSHNLINYLPIALFTYPREFNCSYNLIDSILAQRRIMNLDYFNCEHNNISRIDSVYNIGILNIGNNPLTKIPNISDVHFNEIFIDSLTINEIPTISPSLTKLHCEYNPNVHCLPYLPNLLTYISYDSSALECLPNIVSGAVYLPPSNTLPLCNPYISTCANYPFVKGIVYYDNNNNCINDTIEPKLANISIQLQQGTTVVQSTSSYINGAYSFNNLSNGHYLASVDTNGLPFNVFCISSGIDTITIDSNFLSSNTRDYALRCKSGIDIGTTGIMSNDILRAGTTVSFTVNVGDMSKLYGVSCTNTSGKIVLNYTGPLNYVSPSGSSFIPDTILPHRLVWNISDFSLLDFYHQIIPSFHIDSAAIVGNLVCFNTEIYPIIDDRIPSNNNNSQCFHIVSSHDPNFKEVNPSGNILANQDWVYYTIHFQNTGTSYAENIYILDTIDTDLNINTIQVVGSSHAQYMEVLNTSRAVRFNFLNINLPDSNTNEELSHGWIKYRIKLKNGITEGTNITNTAHILFDLNSPIVTNTTTSKICNHPSFVQQSFTINSGQHINVGTNNYTTNGVFTDILSNLNGCDSIVQTSISINVGIAQQNPISIITYPNPANNEVLIQLEGHVDTPLYIYDIYGNIVFENTVISNKYVISTNQFASGNYIIKCGMYNKKLIIIH